MERNSYGRNHNLSPFPDCVLCAAGRAGRMGDFKPLLPWAGGTLLDAALGAARSAGCRVILVAGYRGAELEERYRGAAGVTVVRNDDWERGMVSSICRGAALVRTENFFVAHADMPLLTPELYRALNAAYDAAATPTATSADGRVPLVLRPRLGDGAAGHPVLFGSGARPLIAAFPDGESLKPLLSRCGLRFLDTADTGCAQDVDEPAAYLDLLTRRGRSQAAAPPAEASPTVCVVTGPRGAGKTTELRRRFFQAAARGTPSCLVSQVQAGARDGEGRAAAFDLELLSWDPAAGSAVRRLPLARMADADAAAADAAAFTLALGPYRFNPAAFDAAPAFYADFLRRTEGTAGAGRFLALDEVGRLELERRGGLRPVLEAALGALRRDSAAGISSSFACAARMDTLEALRTVLRAEGLDPEVLSLNPGFGHNFLDQPLQG